MISNPKQLVLIIDDFMKVILPTFTDNTILLFQVQLPSIRVVFLFITFSQKKFDSIIVNELYLFSG
jgi:energy-converting hydrogenase Eha subunit E